MAPMSTAAAALLVLFGVVSLATTWNAAKPVLNPTRRYSPLWLPAMVVTELAPFWLTVQLAMLLIGAVLGGPSSTAGRIGGWIVVVSVAMTVWLMIRSAIGVRRLTALVEGAVQPGRGVGRWFGRPTQTPVGIVEQARVAWRGDLTLDVIRPIHQLEHTPVVIYVHGGGWTGGDPQRQARDLYHALSLDGWVVLSVRYPFTPSVSVETQIETIRQAVAWARQTWAPSRVVLAGGSAGGHLAAMVALTSDEPVDACVGIYGVYDMANRNRTRAPWTKIRNEVMQASVDEAMERYRTVSPLDQIDGVTPPFLVVHGTHDTLVPIGEATQFVDALRAAQRPVDFLQVFGAQHAFDALSSPTSRTAAAAIRTWLRRVVVDAPSART